MARLAEQAYRFEPVTTPRRCWAPRTGTPPAPACSLANGCCWTCRAWNADSSKPTTALEIDQAFSLTQVDPVALVRLSETRSCSFTLPELFFDLVYPGHYRRQIKSVRLTIPCIKRTCSREQVRGGADVSRVR